MNERFLVIGSNSFTGATFVDFVLENGCDVVGISRSEEVARTFLPYKWCKVDGAGSRFRFN